MSAEAACAICGTQRSAKSQQTWYFVIGPEGSKHLCSRKCLHKFAARLVLSRQQLIDQGISPD